MPELPEVETIRAGLERAVGRTITAVQVLHPRPVRKYAAGPDAFAEELTGKLISGISRRGKYLWLCFADGDALVAHLGMSGQFRFDSPGAPLLRNTRVIFTLAAGTDPLSKEPEELRFIDQRLFGGLEFSPNGAELPASVAHIALDLLDPGLDIEATAEKIHSKRTAIKRAILNQEVVSGIGNIYADESLWRASIHYDTPASSLAVPQILNLLHHAQQVLGEAIQAGGTSFDALYVNVGGDSGYFARQLNAYGREGEPCPRCGAAILREPFMNRSSFRCPVCQPAPHAQ